MVGSIEPRKGHIVALRAIAHLQRLDVPAKLVVVGRVAWGGRAIAKALRRYERLGWVEWYADADDAVLSEQYKEADGLIAASYAEGFGLPLVEALQAGLPVLASDIAVFRDIADRGGAMRFLKWAMQKPWQIKCAIWRGENMGVRMLFGRLGRKVLRSLPGCFRKSFGRPNIFPRRWPTRVRLYRINRPEPKLAS